MSNDVDAAAFDRFREAYNSSLHAGDLETWMSTLTDDCVWLMQGSPALVGKEQIRPVVEATYFGPVTVQLDWEFEELEMLGDRALGWGRFDQPSTPKEGGEPVNIVGRFLDVFRRNADGEWQRGFDDCRAGVRPLRSCA